ncbi:MAG: neutral zinc metallopeptidase [Vulcanimicrobiota bacterium]
MKWQGRRGSENVVDRTGGGGGRRALMGGGGLGTLVLVVLLYFMGVSPSEIFSLLSGSQSSRPAVTRTEDAPPDERKEFVSVVLADTEDVWNELFQQQGETYAEPRLVLFEGEVSSACGFASAATGPFYCPGDENLYLDLSFFDQLARDLNSPGDFAQAYVIGHEVGHHVQNQMGTLTEVNRRKRTLSEKESNALQVRVELQADYYAGVWAHHAQRRFQVLEPGDIQEALQAASAIGDDALQKQARGYVVPDSFTHGTSEQRVRWFKKGFERGDLKGGDTFSTRNL